MDLREKERALFWCMKMGKRPSPFSSSSSRDLVRGTDTFLWWNVNLDSRQRKSSQGVNG